MLEVPREEKITAGGTERERARRRQQEPEGEWEQSNGREKNPTEGKHLGREGGREKNNLPGIARGELRKKRKSVRWSFKP